MVKLQDGYIQVTKDCNQDCVFCTQPKEEISFSYDEIKEQILEYKKQGFKSIVYTGGEPTLLPYLFDLIKFTKSLGMDQRVITNGSNLDKPEYCRKLVEAGLPRIIISVHTHIPEIGKKISQTTNLSKTIKGIRNMLDAGCVVHINTTIHSLNVPHLYGFVKFMTTNFPEIDHFVLNFVEIGGRAAENKWVIPKLSDIELQLYRALKHLKENNKTFRVERVPLCYMCDFEEFSSETRRLLGNQQYHTFFVKDKKLQKFNYEEYVKAEDCKFCKMNKICAGIKSKYKEFYGSEELYPLFKSPQRLIDMNIKD